MVLVLADIAVASGYRPGSGLPGGNPVVAALRAEGLIARQRRNALGAATELPVDDPSHPDFEEAADAVRRLILATRDTSQVWNRQPSVHDLIDLGKHRARAPADASADPSGWVGDLRPVRASGTGE
jgi:hypothetical protein